MDVIRKIIKSFVREAPEPDVKMPTDVMTDYVEDTRHKDPDEPEDRNDVVVPVIRIKF